MTAPQRKIPPSTLSQAQLLVNEVDLKKIVKSYIGAKKLTLRSLSLRIGAGHNYLSRYFEQQHPPDAGLLLVLSRHLNINLFAAYWQFLPPELQTSPDDAKYKEEIKQLQHELEITKAQLDEWRRAYGKG